MKRYQVAGIGNAIVDMLCPVNDHFLDRMSIRKGIMQLVEQERAEALHAEMTAPRQASGGSVANTMAGLAALGLKTAFVGRVRDDELGRFYAADMATLGCDFVNPPVPAAELPTSRCMIFVTPDGERSMSTHLGISSELGPEDVDDQVMGASDLVFLEGYLYDKNKGKAAFHAASRACRKGGGRAGIALSDPFCVDRHRNDFRKLVAGEMDFVIGNQSEWVSLYEANDIEDALRQAARECPLVVCTRSGAPVVILSEGKRIEIPVTEVVPVDATGAGDQFAAGFLHGLAVGTDLETAGRMGCMAASEVIKHVGARPQSDLAAMFRAEKLF